ncbi:MAG: hypothetical protein N2C14_17265 [Planctomycetales bacterium]
MMRVFRAARMLLLAWMLMLAPGAVQADETSEPPAVVRETVEEICVLRVKNRFQAKVVFVRDGKAFAERMYRPEEMLFTARGDRFRLVWLDYGHVLREVEAERFSALALPEDPLDCPGPWWAMWRNMRDLKAPD